MGCREEALHLLKGRGCCVSGPRGHATRQRRSEGPPRAPFPSSVADLRCGGSSSVSPTLGLSLGGRAPPDISKCILSLGPHITHRQA